MVLHAGLGSHPDRRGKNLTSLSQSRRSEFTQRWRSDDDAPPFKFFILSQEASGQIAASFRPFRRCQLALVIFSCECYGPPWLSRMTAGTAKRLDARLRLQILLCSNNPSDLSMPFRAKSWDFFGTPNSRLQTGLTGRLTAQRRIRYGLAPYF